MSVLKKSLKIVLLIGVIIFIISYFLKDNLPSDKTMLDSLYQEPAQKTIENDEAGKPFQIGKNGFTASISPKFSYELYGLVVASYNSEVWHDLSHKADPFNTKDICVLWGNNLKSGVYRQMKFSHGEFTCYANFKYNVNSSWYGKFFENQFSNNHLIPQNEEIYKKIKEADIGDQIYLKGFLVDYSVKSQGELKTARNTSVVRNDTGNGACEIVYATDFKILKKGNPIFSLMNFYSKYLIIVASIILIFLPV